MVTKEVAIKIDKSSRKAIGILDTLVADVRDHCDTEDFEAIRRGVGLSIARIIDLLLEPVYSVHPDIDPDK